MCKILGSCFFWVRNMKFRRTPRHVYCECPPPPGGLNLQNYIRVRAPVRLITTTYLPPPYPCFCLSGVTYHQYTTYHFPGDPYSRLEYVENYDGTYSKYYSGNSSIFRRAPPPCCGRIFWGEGELPP